ncbi:MAG: hypothetical protein MJ142_04925 [Clostridia bacterium]|nr:hypothetical protein [Clostridia bacterium]
METKSNFSQGSVPKLIIRLGFPMMLAELVNVLYNVVDRMYIGHIEGEGTLALTGLGVCFPLITLTGATACFVTMYLAVWRKLGKTAA